MNELSVGAIVGNGMKQGMRNLGSISVNVILWMLTIWIPYLNVGTTIGLTVGLVAKSGRGEPISVARHRCGLRDHRRRAESERRPLWAGLYLRNARR